MHESVLLKEVIDHLNIREDLIYVDATVGYGGHSNEILKRLKRGFLFALDQDEEAIRYSNNLLSKVSNKFTIIKSNFINLKEELEKKDISKVDGILFDLGVSSPQLDDEKRGFSYHKDAKLDMRMDKENILSAYEVVNNYSYEALIEILFRYGEEKYAKSIAKRIIAKREIKPIETTLELVEIIKASLPEKAKRGSHPARKTFQAIRIEVNNELKVVEEALEDAINILNVGGRMCVITFHSLEDRIVKTMFKKYSSIDEKVKGLPVIPEAYKPKIKLVINKALEPSKEEIERNNRARSAKLRVIEKL